MGIKTLAGLIGAILGSLKTKAVQRGIIAGGVGTAVAELFNIDISRETAVRISPTSDPEALEFAARAIHWMMGLTDNDVIGPRNIENWNYFHYDPRRGRGWWTRSYTSRKSGRRSFRRGAGRGFGRGWNRARQTRELSR